MLHSLQAGKEILAGFWGAAFRPEWLVQGVLQGARLGRRVSQYSNSITGPDREIALFKAFSGSLLIVRPEALETLGRSGHGGLSRGGGIVSGAFTVR